MGKGSKDKRDIYYRLAKQNAYRSRSAFKLLQVDHYFNIFNNVSTIVDLCAAPGGWSQVAASKLQGKPNSKIISIDLQQFAPIDGVDIIIGDITNQDSLVKIMNIANKQYIDLVICDGAPDVTGFNEFDVYIQFQLVLTALNISIRMLKEGGNFLTKLFKGKYTQRIVRIFLQCFDKVTITKPKACRNASFESFVMCEGFKLSNDVIKMLRQNELNESDIIKLNSICLSDNDNEFNYEDSGVKCVQVGDDEYDSDRTYDLDCTGYDKILNPVQMPIDPPYKYYIDNLKGKNI